MHVVGMVEFHEGVERGFPVGVPTHFEILDDPIFVERMGLQMLGQHVEMNEERLDLGVHTDENQAVPDIALNWLEARAMRERLGPKNDLVANFDIRAVDTEPPSVEVTAKTDVAQIGRASGRERGGPYG